MIFLFNREEQLIHVVGRNSLIEAVPETAINEIQKLNVAIKKHETENLREILKEANTIGHYDKAGDFQLYKIASLRTDVIAEIAAVHVAHDELSSSHIIKDVRFTDRGARFALERSIEGSRWQVGHVDELGVQSYTLYYVPPADAIKRWTERFGGEIRYRLEFNGQRITGRYIDGVEKLGRDTGKRFVHGHNALEIKEEQDFSSVYTAIIGRGKGEEKFDDSGQSTGGYGRRIGFEDITWTSPDGIIHKPAGQDYIELPDRTALYGHTDGSPRFEVKIFEDITDPYELIEETYRYLQDASRPKILYSSTVNQIGDVELGDRVHIIRKDLGIHYTTRIRKVVRDLLFDENSRVELGDYDFFRRDMRKEKTDEKIGNVENEIETVRSGTETRFEQTDERISTEVERLDGDLEEARASWTVEADGIRGEVIANRTYTDEKLGEVREEASTNFDILAGQVNAAVQTTKSYTDAEVGKVTVENSSQFNILSGRINSKAESSTVTALGTKVTTVEQDLNAVEGTLTQKVSYTDYTGANIISRIQLAPASAIISATKIDLEGIVRVADTLELGRMGNGRQKGIKFNNNSAWIHSTADNIHIASSYIFLEGRVEAFHPYFGTGNPMIVGYSSAQRLAIGMAGNYLNVYDSAGNMRRVRFE